METESKALITRGDSCWEQIFLRQSSFSKNAVLKRIMSIMDLNLVHLNHVDLAANI